MKINKLAILAAAALSFNSASAVPIWNAGHGDLGIGYDAGDLDPHVHLHTGATVDGVELLSDAEYAPGDVIPQIAFAKSSARSAGTQWNFLGVAASESVWIFPEIEDATLPFIGIGAEELDPLDWSTDFTITLTGISGSGVTAGGFFSLYTTDSFGDPVVSMASFGGISGTDHTTLAAGGHAHYNFAFTKPGIYEVTFSITGNHTIDGEKSANATYAFQVVPEPTSLALIVLGGGTLLLRRRRTA